MLLEQWLLRCKIMLSVKQMVTATFGLSLRRLAASIVGRKATLGLKAILTNYLLNTLKSPWIIRVII